LNNGTRLKGEEILDEMRSEIHLEGDLDKAQRKRLLEIATLCPVHRTLSSEIKIKPCWVRLDKSISGKRGPFKTWHDTYFAELMGS
jgi:hypothetical protein